MRKQILVSVVPAIISAVIVAIASLWVGRMQNQASWAEQERRYEQILDKVGIQQENALERQKSQHSLVLDQLELSNRLHKERIRFEKQLRARSQDYEFRKEEYYKCREGGKVLRQMRLDVLEQLYNKEAEYYEALAPAEALGFASGFIAEATQKMDFGKTKLATPAEWELLKDVGSLYMKGIEARVETTAARLALQSTIASALPIFPPSGREYFAKVETNIPMPGRGNLAAREVLDIVGTDGPPNDSEDQEAKKKIDEIVDERFSAMDKFRKSMVKLRRFMLESILNPETECTYPEPLRFESQ